MHRQRPQPFALLIVFLVFCPVVSASPAQQTNPVNSSLDAADIVDAESEDSENAASSSSADQEDSMPMGLVDWGVIALYACCMISVGQYYGRRVNTMDDYFLGGRTMKPWTVGLSLFATLVSSISFLSSPGEMIKHGPMVFADMLGFPIIAIVVGWVIIPQFMKLRVTSANEILEKRLGFAVRIVGAVLFLSLRLLWMAVVIYATSRHVLVPLLGWDVSATPWLCAILGVVTILYTAEGGIQAVVITDVIQSFVLLGGAILAIVLITIDMGGFSEWWPTEWVSTWDPPRLWFDSDSRVTASAAIVAGFFWYVCTAASDQMVIQRYLTTRDVRAARQMYCVSLAVNCVVVLLLACLGLALLAWFRSNPQMMKPGMSLTENADQLLPRFITMRLPVGVRSIVISALLAAAMSSLSSGVNSVCTIVTVDFIDRLRKIPNEETDHIRLAKSVAWGAGAIVVLLSLGADAVPGNLLEVTFRVSNLLVGPLFVIFFMAMYVPWATSAATIAGACAGATAAIAISFYQIFGLSFLWIVPVSALTGVTVATIFSGFQSFFQMKGSS